MAVALQFSVHMGGDGLRRRATDKLNLLMNCGERHRYAIRFIIVLPHWWPLDLMNLVLVIGYLFEVVEIIFFASIDSALSVIM